MAVLKLGYALEGNSDYPVIPQLVRRVIIDAFPAIELASDAVLRPPKRGHGFIRDLPIFARQLHQNGVNVAVAVIDTDNVLISERRKLLSDAKSRCSELNLPLCIADGLAVRAVEAWLLADERAIFQIFDGDRTSVTFPPPEQEPTPKARLNQVVRTLTEGRELSFVSYAEELASTIRLSTLRQKCGHFDDLARNVTNCVREWQRF